MACEKTEKPEPSSQVHITGQITVNAELDTTGDYADIELKVLQADTAGAMTDTLFFAVTDSVGNFAGDASIQVDDFYSMIISRYGQNLALFELILADGDTVHINAELPNVSDTSDISSLENDLLATYDRLHDNVDRLIQFASAGHVSEDTLFMELQKWSDMFWDFYEDNRSTYVSRMSAASSIRLLEGVNEEMMMDRLNHIIDQERQLMPFASRAGIRYYTENYNLDRAIAFTDSLFQKEMDDRFRLELEMNRIKLLYDSARVDQAKLELSQFKEQYSTFPEASEWIESFEYDLTTLAPGSEMPDFEIVSTDGEIISKENLKGKAYVLEFTRLENFLYQQQYDRSVAIYHIYRNYDIEFVTIPFGASEILINAFFDERAKLWPFAQPETFEVDEIENQFNINTLPTRILVDKQGNVVRKYEGTEFNDIIRGLQIVLNENLEEETL